MTLFIKDVLLKVTRCFASVRAALTEQRAQATSVGQQVAAAVAKMDAIAVSLERFVALRGEQDNGIASMKGQLDAIAQMQE